MSAFCRFNFVLSTSKLSLYAIIPMLLEYSANLVLIATTNNKLKSMVAVHADDFDYPIMYADDEDSLDAFVKKMIENKVRVGIIHINHPLFKEMMKQGNGRTWFSACRSGLFTYIPLIKEYATKPMDILCFDNDKTLIDKAKAICADSKINIYKCVAHSVCSAVEYDMANRLIKLSGGKEAYFYFPPEAKKAASYLYNPREAISKHAQLRFAEDAVEFQFYIHAKMIDINAIHTMICALAYIEGNKKGIPLAEIPTMRFSELLDKIDTQRVINEIHESLYDKYLQPVAIQLGERKEVHSWLTAEFVDYLFSSAEETVGRGLDCRDDSYIAKLEQHMSLLKSTRIAYITETFDVLMKLI